MSEIKELNKTAEALLQEISNLNLNSSEGNSGLSGAYNLRIDGTCAGRQSSDNIIITSRPNGDGLEIHIRPGTKGESVSIPACVTHGNIDDLVYNDFYVGKDADIVIVAGCGIHTETGEPARHNGIHRFILDEGAHVKYVEKHIGTGKGEGLRYIDPITEVELAENSLLEIDSAQIGGVDRSTRKTTGKLAAGAKLLVRERILTEFDQTASTDFVVELNGEGSGVDIISRSVARGNSRQDYHSVIIGNAPCTGHTECDAIIADNAFVDALPELRAHHSDAALIHEAAIGKIAGEQIMKLCTLGLTEEEATAKIVEGFLN